MVKGFNYIINIYQIYIITNNYNSKLKLRNFTKLKLNFFKF